MPASIFLAKASDWTGAARTADLETTTQINTNMPIDNLTQGTKLRGTAKSIRGGNQYPLLTTGCRFSTYRPQAAR